MARQAATAAQEVERLRADQLRTQDPAELQRLARQLLEAGQESVHRGPGLAEDALRFQLQARDEGRRPAGGGVARTADVTATLLWPSYPTAFAQVREGDFASLVRFEVKTSGSARLRLVSRIEGYTATAVTTITVKAGAEETVEHRPTFFPAAVSPLRDPVLATLHVEVHELGQDSQALVEHNTLPVQLLPPTTALLSRTKSDPDSLELKDYLACWVTGNSEAVHDLLREAAENLPIGGSADPLTVRQQVSAIFEAVRARELRYVSTVRTQGVDGYFSQRIRFPAECLVARSANCIDGAVLFASLLEAASIDAAIVVVPHHALVAWRAERTTGSWCPIETTMVNSHSFEEACHQGNYYLAGPKVQIADVRQARERGILPMGVGGRH